MNDHDAGREARLRTWAHEPLWVDEWPVFEDGRFRITWVAMAGGDTLALAGEPFQFETPEEARAFGARVQRIAAAALSESTPTEGAKP